MDGDDLTKQANDPKSVDGEGRRAPAKEGGLAEYRRRKLELAELIRVLLTVANERHDDGKREKTRSLLARLAEDEFQLAVVGQFSRGKSTLMNAILGRPYLPTGALPMTSVVTSVRYGSRPRVLVRRKGSTFPIEKRLDELVRYVSQASAEREELRVVSAEVEVPAEVLRLGFTFVDTPGVGSAIAENTATTESFLPEADAVIFVTSFDAPLSEAEMAFLAEVRDHVGKLFLVVNKLDLVSSAEADRVLAYVGEQVRGNGAVPPRIFATSARGALEAKVSGERAGLAESGLPELEHALVQSLTGEKSRVFLERVCGRAEGLLHVQRLELELGRLAQAERDGDRSARQSRFDARIERLLDQVRDAAHALGARIEHELPSALSEQSRSWPEELERVLTPALKEHEPDLSGRSGARSRLERAGRDLVEPATTLLADWLRQRVIETRSLLVRIAADEITRLHALQASIEEIAAEAFGVAEPGAAATDGAWAPADLPQLTVADAEFELALELPWWFGRVPSGRPGRAWRRWDEGVNRAIDGYCVAARQALEEAADQWAYHLGANAERDTGWAVKRLRERLRLPGMEHHLAQLAETEQRLSDFRAKLSAWQPEAGQAESVDLGVPAAPPISASTCAICERVVNVPFEYLAKAQYELARSEKNRLEHAARGGFCPLHTWHYAQMASDLGVSLGYSDLAEAAGRSLRTAADTATTETELRTAVAHFLLGNERCPVCRAVAEAERKAIASILHRIASEGDEYQPPALCMPHLASVLSANDDVADGKRIARVVADVLERDAEDLRTYSLKRESLRRHLLNDEERDAYQQTIARMGGARELVGPWWRDDDEIRFPEE
jgi:GTPase SAR1 family protein